EDLRLAWEEALAALRAAAIDLNDAPLFLVLGRPAGGEQGLFPASGVSILVEAPARPEAPLRVYACQGADGSRAVYVTCRAASVLAQVSQSISVGAGSAPSAVRGTQPDPFKSLTSIGLRADADGPSLLAPGVSRLRLDDARQSPAGLPIPPSGE